jgi:hypothetical protein
MDVKKSNLRHVKKRIRGPVTGVRLSEHAVKAAKHHAVDQDMTLREVVEAAVLAYLRLKPEDDNMS